MSVFFEKEFYKEFKSLMVEFRNEISFSIRDLAIPFKKPMIVEKVFIKGIEDERYSVLNDTFVVKRKGNSITRNLYKNNGEIKGESVYKAKEGNLIIVTTGNLRLPFRYEASDSRLEYVDYKVKDGVRSFIYSIPKEYLYRTQQTALVLSQNLKKSHYGGLQITLTNGYSIYLYIVSLKSIREVEGNIPLASKTGIDYSKEFKALQDFWLSRGTIFQRDLLELDTPINEVTNLGYKVFESTTNFVGIDEFSIAEREEMKKRSAY